MMHYCKIKLLFLFNILILIKSNKVAYLSFKSIYNKALNLSYFDCDVKFESVLETYHY